MILLYTSGYRAEHSLQHYRTIHSLPIILGSNRKKMPSTWRHVGRKEISLNMTMWVVLQKTMPGNSSPSLKNFVKTWLSG
jgi:hypothetical protein